MGKEDDEFNSLLKKARSYIERGNFDKAVLMYSDIRRRFERLPKQQKSVGLVREVNIFYEELSLYLRLNEAYFLACEGNLERLRDVLDYIYNLEVDLSDVRSASSLLKAAEKGRISHLKFYNVRGANREFEEVYSLIEILIKKRKWNSVYREYAHLLMVYNKIKASSPDEPVGLYERLNKLIRDIKIYKSLHDSSNNKMKRTRVETGKEELEEKKGINKRDKQWTRIKRVIGYSEKRRFKCVRKAINEGDLERAYTLLGM